MRLRSRSERKAVRKYDDLDYHDHQQDELRQRTPKPVDSSLCYRGRVVEYNPNLRPAVFPTIPLDQEVEERWEGGEDGVEAVPSLTAQSTYQPLIVENDRSNQGPELSRQSFDFSAFKHFDMFASTSMNDRWSRDLDRNLKMSPVRTPSPKSLKRSNGPENKVYVQNLKLLDKFSDRTETDWNIADMETSDEDEVERSSDNPKDLAWDNVSVAQRLSIVDVVEESCNSLETTFKVLRLNAKQRLTTLALLEQRNEYIDAEETAMRMVRDRASEILLNGNEDEIDWLTKHGGYAKLMEDNVYIGVGKIEYLTSTHRELRLAKRYLATCGFKSELLDHWVSESTVKASDAVTTTSESELRPAAFPTIPFGQVYKPQKDVDEATVSRGDEPITEQLAQGHDSVPPAQFQLEETSEMTDIRPDQGPIVRRPPRGRGRPPAAKFPKPKNSVKSINRHHTTHSFEKEKKDQETSQKQGTINDREKDIQQLTQDPGDAMPSAQPNKPAENEEWHGHGHGHGHYSTAANRSVQPMPMGDRIDHRAAHNSNQPERQVQPSTDPGLEAKRRPSYQVPEYARYWALPPQLAQQRDSWAPDMISSSSRQVAGSQHHYTGIEKMGNGNGNRVVVVGRGVRRQCLNEVSNTKHRDPRVYTYGGKGPFRHTAMQEEDSSKPQTLGSTRVSAMGFDPENRQRSPLAQMPPPPKPAKLDLSMIDPALRQQTYQDNRSPSLLQAVQQYAQGDVLSPDTARTSPPRKRPTSATLGMRRSSGHPQVEVPRADQAEDSANEYVPSKKARKNSKRRKSVI